LVKTDIVNRITKFVIDVSGQSQGHRPPIVLVYFASHGINFNGTDYFAPADFKPRYEDDVSQMGIPLKFVQDRLALVNPTLQIVIADACRTTKFEFPLISTKSSGEALPIQPGFVPPEGGSRRHGKDDRLVIYTTLLGETASGGSAASPEGLFAQRFVESIGNALDKTRKAATSGASDISSITRLLDAAKKKMAQSVGEIQRAAATDDADDFIMFPTQADYEGEAASYAEFNERMTQFLKNSENWVSKSPDPVASKIKQDSYLYCQYVNWAFKNGISPYSYFGGAALQEADNLGHDLEAHEVRAKQLIADCDRGDLKTLSNDDMLIAPMRLPTGGFVPAKESSLPLLERQKTAASPILIADNSAAPPIINSPAAKPGVFVVSDALASNALAPIARETLSRFSANVPIDALAVASTDADVYRYSNLSGQLLGKVHRADILQIKEIGGQTPGNESLKILTDQGLIGYVRQEFVDSGRIAVSFAMRFRDGDASAANPDLGTVDYNSKVVDELLSSSIVVDAAFAYGPTRDKFGLARAGRAADYFSTYWTDAQTSVPRLLPYVGPQARISKTVSPDDAPEQPLALTADSNVVKATFVLLPLRKDVRTSFLSVNGPSVSRRAATDVSDFPNLTFLSDAQAALAVFDKGFTDDACRAEITAQMKRGPNSPTTVYVQYGPDAAGSKASEAMRALLKSVGYGVPSSEKTDKTSLPISDEVRVCPNRGEDVAGSIRNTLNACGLGDFSLKIMNNYRPCAAVSRGNTIEVWLRQDHKYTFQDCKDGCPQMVAIPKGIFRMGSPKTEPGHDDLESEPTPVTIDNQFALGIYDVTVGEWSACVNDGGCRANVPVKDLTSRQPVVNVSFKDAQAYVSWLSRKTSKQYRLPSETEWEYAARAGTSTAYYWGADVGKGNANCDGCGSQWDNKRTAPVGSFRPNPFGLFDMAGNVWQWTEDCYVKRPILTGGSAFTEANCGQRVIRGGAYLADPPRIRSANRNWGAIDSTFDGVGFRVARAIDN
jgi:formylglycine-generating enzyme required for sulfatase activity